MAEQHNSFQLLKEKLTTAPVLNYPDFQQEFLVTTDASDYTIGAVTRPRRPKPTNSIGQQNFMQGRTKL